VEIVVALPSRASALDPVVGRGSMAARAFPFSTGWRDQEGDREVCSSLAVVDCCQPPVCLRKWVFQVICCDFTGISSLTAFLPWAWLLAGSPLTSSCSMSQHFSPWGIKQLSSAGCCIQHGGSWMVREIHPGRGLSPERLGRRGDCPTSPRLGSTSLVFSLWLKQCC